MGKIVIMSGPSSSGKDTIARELLKNNNFSLKKIMMHTTRPIRTGELDGREYYFSTEEIMRRMEEEKRIIELRKYDTKYGPWYYFTSVSSIDLEKSNYFQLNTLEGLDKYVDYYGEENIISILIMTDDGIRLSRALARERGEINPKYDEMCRRFLADTKDFSYENIKKRNITSIIENNGSLEETVTEVNKVLSLHL